MRKPLSILSQYLIPQHLLSRFVGKLAHAKHPFIKKTFIHRFAKRYGVNMEEALEPDLNAYASFSDFFARALRPEARPIDDNPRTITSPSDGIVSEIGIIEANRLMQVKGFYFDLHHLLGQQTHLTPLFENGNFATFYLAPKDYHRVHMPLTGALKEMIYVPGKLFSVNQKSSQHIPNLFARNERVIAVFETASGPMAVILVGAMIVASIHMVWASQVAPNKKRHLLHKHYDNISLDKGQELGHFTLGSTVIILFGPHQIAWHTQLAPLTEIKMGQAIGTVL